MGTNLPQLLEARGYRGRVVPVQHLRDLQENIETHHREGHLDEAFYQERLTGFVFGPPASLAEARSLIVVAAGQPQVRFTFTWNGKRTPIIVPPTYLHWRETDKQVENVLAEMLGPKSYTVAQAVLPKKLLAVRSGLAAYGRNNIAYVAGMGSFHRLVAFYSDFPCEQDEAGTQFPWQEPKMMERCQHCHACLHHCPTGAITSERFLLRAERCITFHNEKAGNVPFPAWLDASWHNCLVGCLHCQLVCPENKGFLAWIEEGVEFSAEETALLLEGTPLAQLPAATVRKLEQSDMVDLIDILPRNLRVLLTGESMNTC